VTRIAGAVVAALLLSGAAARGADPQEPDAAVLLRQSMQAPGLVSYVGQLETVRFASNRANATIVRVEHEAPSSTRRWYLAPESLYGDYIITRGSATYEFDTKRARVTVSHNPSLDNAVSSGNAFDRVLTNYRSIVAGNDIIAGRPTVSVVLLNKYTGERVVRLWLDARTHLVLKKEEYHANGSVASQTRFEELRYTSKFPDGIFATDAPSGYQQVPGRDFSMPSGDIQKAIDQAGFKPITPKRLPQGFALSSGDTTEADGVRTLHLAYSDGLRTISLFENAKGAAADFGSLRPRTIHFEGHDAQYVEDGPTTLLTWKEKGLYFALVGDLLRAELVEIAQSVVP
jgi:negative regulator of sigma E activity